MSVRLNALRAALVATAATACVCAMPALAAEVSATVGGATYVSKGIVGVGRMPAALKDKFGETFGSGSGLAMDTKTWRKTATGYEGEILILPDRGYNVEGTTDYRTRINRLSIKLVPVAAGVTPSAEMQQTSVEAKLADTVLLTEQNGTSLTGLDPEAVRAATGTLPMLPQARTGAISLDPEAIIIAPDGTMIISDEYGPAIYRFSADGKLIGATLPPEAFLPLRKGAINFSSNNPGPGAAVPEPKNPDFGRQNNQGLEGAALTPDGKTLIAVLQSATRQDGGDAPATRDKTRALVYDVSDLAAPKLKAEYVVPLPVFKSAKGDTLVAAMSEIYALGNDRFLMLSRDSNNGQGLKGDTSLYRRIDIVDVSGATNIASTKFDATTAVAPKGVVDSSVIPAKLTGFIDINDNADLNRFGLHNGAPNDRNNLSEKWEGLAVASVLDPAAPDDYFLFVANDNDFLTQNGFQVGAAYKADGGADVDTTFLVWRVTLPGLAKR